MIIAITGASGFLGAELAAYYERGHKLKIIDRKREGRLQTEQKHQVISFDLLKDDVSGLKEHLAGCDMLFHCAYSPDFSPEMPVRLLDIYQQANPRGKFVYFSSINTMIPSLKEDPYTAHKKEMERLLFDFKPKIAVLIVRPSFLISSASSGNFRSVISFAKKFHFMPLLAPGPSHYFLSVEALIEIVDKEIRRMNEGTTRVINVIGKNLIPLSDMVKTVLTSMRIPVIYVDIPTKPARYILRLIPFKPAFIMKRMKLFTDTVYAVPEGIEKIISEEAL